LGKILLINTGPAGPLVKWAEAAARRAADYQPVTIYVCPVPGADEIARIIAAQGTAIVKALPGFAETVGKFWKGPDTEDRALIDCSFGEVPPGAELTLPFKEGIEELRAKVDSALGAIAETHRKENVAIVSHRALTVVMILYLLHMQNSHYRQVAQAEGAVNLFETRGGVPSALYINDTCHLHGLI
jgi:broad specificity phosphatase PhoE